MENKTLIIRENRKLNPSCYMLTLEGTGGAVALPGQFVNLRLEGFYLRRPISVYDAEADTLKLIYKVVGGGTEALARMKPGESLDTLLMLGNGFDISRAGRKPVLVGGGIGMPPVYSVCKALAKEGIAPQVVLGFNTADDLLPTEDFLALGVTPVITTADGSVGLKGFVTDALRETDYDYVFTCGPEPMLKAVYDLAPDGQFSFEERMGCGFGACMGCTCRTKYGYKRICTDGPVLTKDEIIW